MNKYKIRMECISFRDVVVEDETKEEAISKAHTKA